MIQDTNQVNLTKTPESSFPLKPEEKISTEVHVKDKETVPVSNETKSVNKKSNLVNSSKKNKHVQNSSNSNLVAVSYVDTISNPSPHSPQVGATPASDPPPPLPPQNPSTETRPTQHPDKPSHCTPAWRPNPPLWAHWLLHLLGWLGL